MYTNYLLTCSYYDQLISVEDTGRCMQQKKMKTGKSVGFDSIYLFINGFYKPATCANTSERSASSRVWCLSPFSDF